MPIVTAPQAAVQQLGEQLVRLGWVDALLVAGSLATGDYRPEVSDIDLVALVEGPVDASREASLVRLHRALDRGAAAGLRLGCAYVDVHGLADTAARHPTWTHGVLVRRVLSGVTRAELVLHGYAVFGPAPHQVLPPMRKEQVRAAARAELAGYWARAARRPWLWLDPVLADLGLTSMARGRHALATGELLSKTRAVEQVRAPAWLVDQLRARRSGEEVTSPRLRAGWIAWREARRTVRESSHDRRGAHPGPGRRR